MYPRRAYQPSTGRWLSRDPIGERGGVNLAAFVQNSATSEIDSLGLSVLVLDQADDSSSFNQTKEVHEREKKDALDYYEKFSGRKCKYFFNDKEVSAEELSQFVTDDIMEYESGGESLASDMTKLGVLGGKAKHEWDFLGYGKHGRSSGEGPVVRYRDGKKAVPLQAVLDEVGKITTSASKVTAICKYVPGLGFFNERFLWGHGGFSFSKGDKYCIFTWTPSKLEKK